MKILDKEQLSKHVGAFLEYLQKHGVVEYGSAQLQVGLEQIMMDLFTVTETATDPEKTAKLLFLLKLTGAGCGAIGPEQAMELIREL